MTTFYIVRHGETEYNKNGRYQGQTDIPLNDAGRRQTAFVAARLKQIKLDVIYSSDLARALETARACAFGRTIVQDQRLREVHVGACAGMTTQEIAERYPQYWAAQLADPIGTPFPGGESAAQVQDRVLQAMDAIHRRYPEGEVGIVTHGGVVKSIVAAVLDLPLAVRKRIVLDNCSLTVVEWNGDQRRLRSLNDTGHLDQV